MSAECKFWVFLVDKKKNIIYLFSERDHPPLALREKAHLTGKFRGGNFFLAKNAHFFAFASYFACPMEPEGRKKCPLLSSTAEKIFPKTLCPQCIFKNKYFVQTASAVYILWLNQNYRNYFTFEFFSRIFWCLHWFYNTVASVFTKLTHKFNWASLCTKLKTRQKWRYEWKNSKNGKNSPFSFWKNYVQVRTEMLDLLKS